MPETVVRLGNPAPQIQIDAVDEYGAPTGERVGVPAPHLNQSITTVTMRPGFDDGDEVELALSTSNDRLLVMIARVLGTDLRRYAIGILELEGVMATHAAGASPAWVASEDADFAKAVAKHFDCPVGEPTALLVTAGRDALHAQHLGTSAQPASFNYMGVSANVTAPSAANTTLPGEITTGGGGLIRAQATYAHTGGTNTSTLTKTFTANGSDSLPVTIAKIGVFNAVTVGTLAYETLLNATATLTISGDNVAITETVTAG